MRRGLTIVGAVAVVGIVASLSLFKREAAADLNDVIREYPRATSAQDCVDRFRAAVRERKYHMAARYCTRPYADELTRGAQPAHDLGTAIDELSARLTAAGVQNRDVEHALFQADPLPPGLTLRIESASDKEATATLGVEDPSVLSPPPRPWKFDPWFVKAFYADHPRGWVRLVRQADHWLIDVPVSPEMRTRVDRLTRHHKSYVTALRILSDEVRAHRTPAAAVPGRLEELLGEAAR